MESSDPLKLDVTRMRRIGKRTMPRIHGATQPLAHVGRLSHRVVMPVTRIIQSRFARRVLLIALSTWIATWGCLGILLYFQDPPPPYVLDREDE